MKYKAFFIPATWTTQLSNAFGPNLLGLTLFMLIAMGLTNPKAHAQNYLENTIYSFQGGTNGRDAISDLIELNGTLYGITEFGGSDNTGVVFGIDEKTQAVSIFDCFITENGSGGDPLAGLTNVNGILYGTTYNYGAHKDGTIFSLDPDSTTETVVHDFAGTSGQNDGATPQSSLLNVNGILFGTTSIGGIYNAGTLYSFDPSTNTEKVLYSFGANSSDGTGPVGDLIAVNGRLYGTTYGGGTSGNGTVFSLDPISQKETVVYRFTSSDGENPYGGLILVNGKLYGTTFNGGNTSYIAKGGGMVYSVDPTTGTETTLYRFASSSTDGANPAGDLILVNGKLYGTTFMGGTNGDGTVYSVDPAMGTEAIIHSFTDSTGDGALPIASLININGTLYGTTAGGGTNNDGTVFSLTPITLPIAKNDAGRGIANHTIVVGAPGVLGNDNLGSDPTGYATLVTNPTHGTLTFHSDGSFQYIPNHNFVGNDSFTYKDTNVAGTSNTATCSIAIGPIAYDDNARTYFNTALTISAPGLLINDTTGGITTSTALVTNPTHGTIIFNSDGSFKYTPTTGFVGTDSFTYKITNAGGTSAPATCTITVQARTPVANNDAGRVTHNTTLTIAAPGVLGNDNAGDTGTITTSLVSGPSHGMITFHTDGSFVYKPTTGFIGTDSFTYKDTNTIGTSNAATCTLTVQ